MLKILDQKNVIAKKNSLCNITSLYNLMCPICIQDTNNHVNLTVSLLLIRCLFWSIDINPNKMRYEKKRNPIIITN